MKAPLLITAIMMMSFSFSLEAQTGFAKLPAKERTRLAQKEELESESDQAFQSLMTEGMVHFESNRFNEAIEAFEKAEDKRPLNVYPPVMIEDVKLAMEMYKEPAAEEPQDEELKPEEAKAPELTADERVAIMYEKEMAKVRQGTPPPPKEKDPKEEPLKNEVKRDAEGLVIFDSEIDSISTSNSEPAKVKEEIVLMTETKMEETKPVKKEESPAPQPPKPEINEDLEAEIESSATLANEFPEGVTEKVFMQGNKEVTQRIVVKDGLGNEYRKVKHPWGGVFYFKDSSSITERVWLQETQ